MRRRISKHDWELWGHAFVCQNEDALWKEHEPVTLWLPVPCTVCGEAYKRDATGRLLYTQQTAEAWTCAACEDAKRTLDALTTEALHDIYGDDDDC